MRDQVEERLQFYESGATPRKNADVMKGVIDILGDAMDVDDKKKDKKKDKKDKKRKSDAMEVDTPEPVKEKKSKKADSPVEESRKEKKSKKKSK